MSKRFLTPIELVNLPSDPPSGSEGDIYWNTTDSAIKVYDGFTWSPVGGSSGFILIDGDNMPDETFFDMQLDFRDKDPVYKKAQFRWKAVNAVNGLRYGNGGMSSWTKEYVANMQTHEAQTSGDVTRIADFCLDSQDNLYWAMYDCYSTTYPNATPFQAFRAGFREGVKMCLLGGRKPTVEEFKQIPSRNLDNLTVWHNVGADVQYGLWAIYGARLGTYMTMLTDWDAKNVQWFDNFEKLWLHEQNVSPQDGADEIGDHLKYKLGLPICTLSPEQSIFFKRHYNSDKHNLGPLVKEMDVIRKIEGW
mgnify:CR=1 FL=1